MRQGGLILAAGHVRSKERCRFKKRARKNPAAHKTHDEIHSSPATTIMSRRCASKQAPRVSPYLSTSIDAGFVETGLVQLAIGKNDKGYKYTGDRHTQTN